VKPETQRAPVRRCRDAPSPRCDAQGNFWTQCGDDNLNRWSMRRWTRITTCACAWKTPRGAGDSSRSRVRSRGPRSPPPADYTKSDSPVDSPTGAPLASIFYQADFRCVLGARFFGRVRRGVEARTAELEAGGEPARCPGVGDCGSGTHLLRAARRADPVASHGATSTPARDGRLTQARLMPVGHRVDTSRAPLTALRRRSHHRNTRGAGRALHHRLAYSPAASPTRSMTC